MSDESDVEVEEQVEDFASLIDDQDVEGKEALEEDLSALADDIAKGQCAHQTSLMQRTSLPDLYQVDTLDMSTTAFQLLRAAALAAKAAAALIVPVVAAGASAAHTTIGVAAATHVDDSSLPGRVVRGCRQLEPRYGVGPCESVVSSSHNVVHPFLFTVVFLCLCLVCLLFSELLSPRSVRSGKYRGYIFRRASSVTCLFSATPSLCVSILV
jgi:hypothetical protein